MEKFIEKFKETLEMEDLTIAPNDKFREYEVWDSLAVLSVLAMINEEYDKIISRAELDSVLTVEELYNIIK